ALPIYWDGGRPGRPDCHTRLQITDRVLREASTPQHSPWVDYYAMHVAADWQWGADISVPVSELPARQRTTAHPPLRGWFLSELPARQRTPQSCPGLAGAFSELPARQRTHSPVRSVVRTISWPSRFQTALQRPE